MAKEAGEIVGQGDPVPAPDPFRKIFDTKAFDLISIDFSKMYDTYLFQLTERSNSVRLFTTIVSAPFIIFSASGAFGQLSTAISGFLSVPIYVYVSAVVAGLLGLIPYQRFWDAHAEVYKLIRYMNNFRSLYLKIFEKEFAALDWALYVERSPFEPIPRPKAHWVPIFLALMAFSNVLLVAVGLYYCMVIYDKNISVVASLLIVVLSAVLVIVHYAIYKKGLGKRGMNEPAEIQPTLKLGRRKLSSI